MLGWCVVQERKHGLQVARPGCGRHGLFAEFFSRGVGRDRDVEIRRRWNVQAALQVDLARSRVEQIGPADHMGNALFRVIDDHRKLVGKDAVCAGEDEVSDLTFKVLRHESLKTILERDLVVIDPQTVGTRLASGRRAGTAGSWIYTIGEVLARAAAWESMPLLEQAVECVSVQLQPGTLVCHRSIPMQSALLEAAENIALGTRDVAGRVEIFHAHEPRSACASRIQVTGDRGHEASEMERAGWGGSEAAPAGRSVHTPPCCRTVL